MPEILGSVAVAAAVVLGGLLGTVPAKANVYDVMGLGIDAVITTNGSNNVTNITGSIGTYGADLQSFGPITGFLPPPGFVGGGTNLGADNIFGSTSPWVDINGVAFALNASTIGAGLWYNGGGQWELFIGNYIDDRRGSISVSETPLPSTWTMLIAAFAGFGFLAYRGTKKSGAALAAS